VSSNVWKVLSQDLDYKLPSNSLYIMFYEDRNGWKSRLIKMLGLGDNINNFKEVDQTSSSDTECSSQSNRNKPIKKLFKITVPFDFYLTISPIT